MKHIGVMKYMIGAHLIYHYEFIDHMAFEQGCHRLSNPKQEGRLRVKVQYLVIAI